MVKAIGFAGLFGVLFVCGTLHAQVSPTEYKDLAQGELVAKRDLYAGKKVQVAGAFQFAGSDFCYQIRKTDFIGADYNYLIVDRIVVEKAK